MIGRSPFLSASSSSQLPPTHRHLEALGGSTAAAFIYIMRRDEQRVGEIKKHALKADGPAVTIDVEVDAAPGHELLFLTEMPNFNSSTTITLSDLSVTLQK
jgi:hypothetical protein